MSDLFKSRTSIQSCRLHNVCRYALNRGQVKQHRQSSTQYPRKDNTEFNQIRITEPYLRLSAKKFHNLVCHTIIRMPDPSPDDHIYRSRNQRRKDIKSGQAFLQSDQFIEQKRLDQRDKKTHTQLKEQKNKSIFPGFPVKLHPEHFQ